jgi:hypothetical protein
MGQPTRRVGAATVGVTLLVCLAACGGGGSKSDDDAATALPHDSSSGSGSDTASGSASDPIIEQENPQRFIARWAAAEARMQHGGPATTYLTLSRDCPVCFQLARTVARYYGAGGYIRGGSWRIDSIKMAGSANGFPVYVVHARAAPMIVQESSSAPAQHVPGGPVVYDIGLVAKGSSFVVTMRTRGS